MAIFNDYLIISSKEIKYLLTNTETQKILSTNVYSYVIENLGTITKSHKRKRNTNLIWFRTILNAR